MEKTEWKEKT